MNQADLEESGGSNIVPKARPSIHSQSINSFGGPMGRYSLRGPKRGNLSGNSGSPQDQGRDEIDNVMSKFACGPSPIPVKHNKNMRRNSFEQYTEDSDDDDDDSKLAKSLPIYLTSYSSEDSDSRIEQTASPGSWNISKSADNTSSSLNASQLSQGWNNSNSHLQPNISSQDVSTRKQKENKLTVLAFLIGIAGLAIGWQYRSSEVTLLANNNYDRGMFYKDLNELGQKYKINDDSLLRIKSGIATISEKQDAGSFIFTYQSSFREFNENNFNDFVNAVALFAAKYLRNDSASVQHVVVDGSKLQMQTYSDLISEYRDDVSRTGVMLLKDLEAVPSNLAMAFHYYCDEFNPLAKKTAIFFTLDLAKCTNSPSKQQSTHANIEKCLANQWSEVPKDNIGPLLTRVVNIVVDVTSN